MRGIVRVVTGGGKTIFAQFCMGKFLEIFPDGRIVIVVPSAALLDQWVVSLVEDFHINSDDIGCYSSAEKSREPRTINVLVINTARTIAESLSLDRPAMLIVDECHRAGSPENARALRGKYSATLGLSATPEREYDDGFRSYIAPALGPIIYEYDYVEAGKDGVISAFALHNVRVAMLDDEELAYLALSRRVAAERRKIARGTGSEEKLARLLQQRAAIVATATMRIPAAVKLAEQHLGHRTIIFHERVDAADKLFSILRARNRSATVYHASIAPPLRRENLRLYRKGVFDILICCRALDEGINVPETAVAIVASSTASIRQRIQRLGRVLRPAPGKQFADIYTIYASDVEEHRLADEARHLAGVCEVSWGQITR